MLFFNKGVTGDGDAYAEGVDLEPKTLLLTSEDLFLKIAESGYCTNCSKQTRSVMHQAGFCEIKYLGSAHSAP